MRSATGRWVSGGDFFDREPELCILEQRVRDGNHVLLTGQRRMGKTSITRELGRRLTEFGGWSSLFADVEDATCPEDVIADIARAAFPASNRVATGQFGRCGTAGGRSRRGNRREWVSLEDPGGSGRWKLETPRGAAAPGLRGERTAGASGDRRTADLSPADAARSGRRNPCRGVSELVARRVARSWRSLPDPHRVRQHRSHAAGAAARNPGSYQLP